MNCSFDLSVYLLGGLLLYTCTLAVILSYVTFLVQSIHFPKPVNEYCVGCVINWNWTENIQVYSPIILLAWFWL